MTSGSRARARMGHSGQGRANAGQCISPLALEGKLTPTLSVQSREGLEFDKEQALDLPAILALSCSLATISKENNK